MKINWQAAADACRAALLEHMDAASREISIQTHTYAPVNLAADAEALMEDLNRHADEVRSKVALNNSSNIDNGATFKRGTAE
jgi:hypothetical protein